MTTENTNRLPENRRKRVNRLKKMIVSGMIVMMMIPTVICIALGIRIHNLNIQLKGTKAELAALSEKVETTEVQEITTEEIVVQPQSAPVSTGSEINSETHLIGTGNENANSSQDAETKDGKKRVYLTFDDGPSNNTEEILDILKEYNVKATFFVVGNTSDHGKELMKRIVDEGHSIGVHSFSHKYGSIYDTEEAFFKDYNKMSDYICEITGVTPKICRLPGGSSNTVSRIKMPDIVRELNEQGIVCYDWNISGGDATGENVSAETISRNVLNGIERFQTSVVLLHDGADKNNTVKALTMILENLTDREDIVIEKITEDTPVILHITL